MKNDAETFNDPLTKDTNGQDDLDSIFGEQIKSIPVDKKSPDIVIPPTNTSDITNSNTDVEGLTESCVPSLRGDNFDEEYLKVVNRIKAQYSLLPKLDYDKMYKELSELNIKSSPTPNLQTLNDELQKVQAAKDRLSEIFIDVVRSFNFKERAVDILTDAWGRFTLEKNADGRKGDAQYRLSNFAIDLANTQGLLKACTHILKNLDSVHENLSRRITVYQLILKIDLSRNALPDYDFEKKMSNTSDNIDGKMVSLGPSGELPTENF